MRRKPNKKKLEGAAGAALSSLLLRVHWTIQRLSQDAYPYTALGFGMGKQSGMVIWPEASLQPLSVLARWP
jgi:hypothetical protein